MAMANGGGPGMRAAASDRDAASVVDFGRLETAVGTLVERQAALRAENAELARRAEDAEQRARALDERLLAEIQRRRDAVQLIDQLLARVDQLDAHLGSRPSGRSREEEA